MKTYYKSGEIAHAWAHQLSPHGKSPSNMRFEGGRFYSYATCIAELIEVRGQKFALVSDYTYSSSTSRHLSDVRSALRNVMPIIPVAGGSRGTSSLYVYRDADKPAVQRWAKDLIAWMLKQAAEAHATSKTRRAEHKRDWDLATAAKWMEHAAEVRRIWKVRGKNPASLDKLSNAILKEGERIKAEERRRAKQREKDAAEALGKWIAGDPDVYVPRGLPKAYLRIHKRREKQSEVGLGDCDAYVLVVQTSKGVEFDLDEGQRAYRFCVARREKGWRRNGETFPIGGYQLDSIGPDGVVAGCHRLDWSELERFAKVAGWETA